MEPIFTQCPKCKTVFRVRPEQLHAAHGKVRCSRCQTIFVATEHAYTSAPTPAEQTTQQSTAAKAASSTPRKAVTKPPLPSARPGRQAQPAPAAKPQAERKSDEIPGDDRLNLSQPVPRTGASASSGLERKEREESLTAKKKVEIPLSEEEQLNEDLLSLFAEPEPVEPGIQAPQSDDKVAAPSPPEENLEELLADITPIAESASGPANEMADLQELLDADSSELQAVLDFTEGETEEPPAATPPGSYSLPPELEATPLRSTMKNFLYGAGILLLIAGLMIQYAYSHRVALMEQETLRPWLIRLCHLTKCPIPPPRALDKIELADHLVQSHPRYQHSLLITATLINRADYVQPFPIVEVVMSDLQQKVVARRQFRPEQYLVGDTAEMGFTPNVEVPLMLEVVDPGENAVGFEFNFY